MTSSDSVRVLITGCGAPGISGTVFSLKNNPNHQNIFILGTDINKDAVGRFFCDEFENISSFKNKEQYLNDLMFLVKKYAIDVILPQNTLELQILSNNKKIFRDAGVKIIISDSDSISDANNKFKLMEKAKSLSLPHPEYYLVSNWTDLLEAAKSLGWPHKRVVVKPPESNGSRGVRIIDENISLKEEFFYQKPGSLYTRLDILEKILDDKFPELLVMEYLDGDEFSVDIFRNNDGTTVIPRVRNNIKSGITFAGKVVKNDKINDFSTQLAEGLNLKYCFGFQFIMKNDIPNIIECNPRVQGSMIISTLSNANVIYNSIMDIMGKDLLDMSIKYDTSFTRFWGGISHEKNKKLEVI